MASQILFLKKNKLDISNDTCVLTASQGNTYVNYVRNRSNDSAWVTTGSVDSDLTSIVVDFVDLKHLDNIILIKHNFKAYTVKYWNGSAYVDFSTPIAVSGNATVDLTTQHTFTGVDTTKIQLIVQSTVVANSDKRLYQLVATEAIGQLNGWPILKSPAFDRNISNTPMLSGKKNVTENLGGFSVTLQAKGWRDTTDLTVVESLYDSANGFLVWLCGGDETQFSSLRRGYRKQDLLLMKCTNAYAPEWLEGYYGSGLDLKVQLAEVTD